VLRSVAATGAVERTVVLKIDGLSPRFLRQYLDDKNTLRSRLPWIDHVFAQNGVWLENFYSRGLSLSAPSWSILDTGQHLQIHGNVEYDRYTLRTHDYLNFFPVYLKPSHDQVDMPGVELLDQYGVPLLADRFPRASFQSAQLLQRDVNWSGMQHLLGRTFAAGSVRDFIDEWQVGWSWRESWNLENEALLMKRLMDPSVRYLELFNGEFDHVAHVNNDPVSQAQVIDALDALIGRVWSAILQSPLADSTVLVLVSDHGMTTSPDIISQGYSLVDWFTSRAGGAQQVLTNRHPLEEFKIKGLDVFVNNVVTSPASPSYLANPPGEYPTVALDLDGNERASIGLRNNSLNVIHVLVEPLLRRTVTGRTRAAVSAALFDVLDAVRPKWNLELDELAGDSIRLREAIARQAAIVATLPGKWTRAQIESGESVDGMREQSRLKLLQEDLVLSSRYAAILNRLLTLRPGDLEAGKLKLADLVPRRSLGPLNTAWDLRHYVVGPGADGFVLAPDGRLDLARSFRTMDYLRSLTGLAVRNNVQEQVGPRPIDFIAMRVPDAGDREAIWLYRDEDHQALIQADSGKLRYQPVTGAVPHEDGSVSFEPRDWSAGLPLGLFEDPELTTPDSGRQEWLGQWHSDDEWLRATHRTRYSTAVVGLAEQLLDQAPSAGPRLDRQRVLRRTEMLAVTNQHWNFNTRSFNPGGNHGSFFRESTHAVLLVAGGARTGIPRGLRVETPYDGLSFAPTILALMGRADPGLPGTPIAELLPDQGDR
jgi:Type I phosphodiesterase / nucleotide pyrophosphatase